MPNDILLGVANYNQAQEIDSFLQKLVQQWPAEKIVLADDGSTDDSWQIAARYNIKILRHSQNLGVGAAIRTLINEAKDQNYSAILLMSSNGKMVPSEIPRLIEPILKNEADYVTGNRFLDGGDYPGLGVFRQWSIPIFSVISSVLLGRKFSDITCGFRCYKIDFIYNGKFNINQTWLNRYEMEYYIHFWACQLKLRIKEVPVTIRYDHLEKKRKSKIRPFFDWWSMVKPLIYLRLGLRK